MCHLLQHVAKTNIFTCFTEGEDTSESGVCNLDEDSDSDVQDEEYFFLLNEADDDESTIEEQEAFESKNENEVAELCLDNEKSIEELLKSAYPGYEDDLKQNDICEQHDSSISSSEHEFDSDDDSDSEFSDDDLVSYMNSDSEQGKYQFFLHTHTKEKIYPNIEHSNLPKI